MAEIAKKLHFRKSGANYSISLYNSSGDVGTDYITLRVDGSTVYAKLGETTHMEATDLRIRKSGTTYAVLKSNLVELPPGYIAMFENGCPSGWTRVTEFDELFIRCNSSGGGTGGADTHTHSYSTGTVNTSTHIQDNTQVDTPYYSYAPTHYHWKEVSATSTAISSIPPYLNLVFCEKN
jgi:hypothetical protein